MINENTITLVNEQFNDALRMVKEMNNVCEGAVNAMCTMNTLRRGFEEYRNIVNELAKEIDKYETGANNKAKLIGSCHFAIKDMYVKFKNALAEAEKQNEAVAKKQVEAKPKTIKIMIDTSWPLSPREIQQAIDVLKAFKPVGEDGLGLKSAVETLESFKKSVEKDIEKKTTVKQEGIFFKMGTAE